MFNIKVIMLFVLVLSINSLADITTIDNNTSEAINDRSCINKTFDMTLNRIVNKINIEVNLDHTYRGDLDITLTSPSGTDVDLSSDNGGNYDNLYVKFDDDASTSIVGDNSNHTVVVERSPESALNTFNDEDAKGTWTLKICNNGGWIGWGGVNGEFNYAILEINGTVPPPLDVNLSVNLQMDECYWLGGANGVSDDVKDSSGNALDAQSRNKANNIEADAKICRAGNFINTYANKDESDAVFYPNATIAELSIGKNAPFTVSAWVKRGSNRKWMAGVIKVSDDSWSDGWGIVHKQNTREKIYFFVDGYSNKISTSLSNNTWTHIVGTYDGSKMKIYKNGTLAKSKNQSSYYPATLPISIGDDISGSSIDDRWQGNIDEVKIWHRALSDLEIKTIYDNENAGLNFDGSIRECKSCNGSSINAKSWAYIGIPADSRSTALTVDDVFGDDMNGTFKSDWILFKRTYDTNNNSSSYKILELTDTLEFGQGYWLGSKLYSEWFVDGTPSVDYNSTSSACTASECVEVDLTSASLNFAVDANDGSGPYRYNMVGHVSIKKPVNWADCRFIIDGTAYTPTDAQTAGYANKQIWLYNGTGTDRSNSYTTCDDTMNCKIVPFKGFWVELNGSTKNKTVKLLIPKE